MMIKRLWLPVIALLFLLSCSDNTSRIQRKQLFDDQWLFHRGDVPGAERSSFNDMDWREVDLPHDWSIEDIPGTTSPFDSTIVNGVASGFTAGGTGWYRKHFNVEDYPQEMRLSLQFDGIYMDADIWVNDSLAGNMFYGYTPAEFDITDMVNRTGDNVVAVKVNSEKVTSRWYSGAGIYRHVWLSVKPALHIRTNGSIITTPVVSDSLATVSVATILSNQGNSDSEITARVSVLRGDSTVALEESAPRIISGDTQDTITMEVTVHDPALWSVETPERYMLHTEIMSDGKVVDSTDEWFGIRTIEFSPAEGFLLNGKAVKLKGGCIHHDNGALGVKAYDRAEERKVELLKDAGFNALRMSHNPPSEALLDACDRLGMLVIDEAFDVWLYGHFESDYSSKFPSLWRGDLRAMIERDRNHPSIIMWSIGNEIKGNDTDEIAALSEEMAAFTRAIDPTRPVTAGVNSVSKKKDAYLRSLDVAGYNYSPDEYVKGHLRNPSQLIYASESYSKDAAEYWSHVERYPWIIGDFVWTAFDYIGEASIGWYGYYLRQDFYPWNLAYCGDIDICGERRPQSFYRETLWSEKPMLHISVTPPEPSFPVNASKQKWSHWDWPDEIDSWTYSGANGKKVTVWVYSQCDEVELIQNGISLGKKLNSNQKVKNKFGWETTYIPGQLKAIGYRNGKTVAETSLESAGSVAQISLESDRKEIKADNQDLVYITVSLLDENGRVNPEAEDLLLFEVSGDATIAGLGNGNPMSTESFTSSSRKAWRGKALAIIKAGKTESEAKIRVSTNKGLEKEIIINIIKAHE